MTKYAIAIGTGKEQRYFIELAKELGFTVIGFDQDYESCAVSVCDKFYPISTSQISLIIPILKDYKPTVVIPSPIGKNLRTVGFINDYFDIPAFSFNATIKLTNKQQFAILLQNLGLSYPKTKFYTNLDQLFSELTNLSYPAIIKPIDGSGSRGVLLVENQDTVINYYDYLRNNKSLFHNGVLVQNYISGINLGIDGLCISGSLVDLTVRYKFLTPVPFRVEYAYFAPLVMKKLELDNIQNILQYIIDILKVKSCVLHADLVLTTEGKFVVIEMSLRSSGMFLSSMLLPKYLRKNYANEFLLYMRDRKFSGVDRFKQLSEGTFLLEYLHNPDFDDKVMLTPSRKETQQLIDLEEANFSYSSSVHFVKPTNASDVISRGYVVFRTPLNEVEAKRASFYNLFQEC